MSTKPQIELFLENESGTQQVAYPFVESDHVSLSNGMDIDTMIRQDVSMPTVVHEDLSFKVGVGDQDVSSAIVDSSVAEMTIKGKTYQNILPEPSTHVLTNNKEMFKVNEGLDPNAEIVDGVSKSAILKGNTLVNLLTKTNISVSANTSVSENLKIAYTLPPKKYIMFYNVVVPNTSPNASNNRHTPRVNLEDGSSLYQGYDGFNTSTGRKYWIFTASSNIVDVYYWVQNISTDVVVNNCMLLEYQEGMENWDIPFFRGMQSVEVPVLTTTGKNLFDIEKLEGLSANIEMIENGIRIVNSQFDITRCFTTPFKENTQYTASFKHTQIEGEGREGFRFYYTDGTSSYIIPVSNSSCIGSSLPNKTIESISLSFNNVGTSELTYIQFEEGSTATSYEPYKSNILMVNEEVVLRGIGDVQDTLDCLTGELTQRIGEIVLDGSENWVKYGYYPQEGYTAFIITVPTLNNYYDSTTPFVSADFPTGTWNDYRNNLISEFVWNHDPNKIGIRVKNEIATDVNGIKAFLSANNIRINYKLATPVVRTVDLSSSGNWEKVVLDGSEDESWGDGDNGLSKTHRFYVTIPNLLSGNHSPIIDSTYFTPIQTGTSSQDTPCVQIASNKIHFRIERQIADSLTSFKTWLQQNPLTVWYPTTTHQDSTQVKQPIFFKDGHIQLSSGADNSLIPTLDYQAKTSNSYVMDLMKTNTKYTMKAKSASETFTIDGTSYGAGTNETFTTPTSMTNKFLVMSNNANEEIMILEGDVTDKTIPYFKGIKSAFEGEDKIEVLSQGKNIFINQNVGYGRTTNANTGVQTSNSNYVTTDYIEVLPNKTYISNNLSVINFYDSNKNFISISNSPNLPKEFKTPTNCKYIMVRNYNLLPTLEEQQEVIETLQIEEGAKATTYEPYKSNSTKIPLLSSLRSLPNGVKDEIILDRENNKAKVVQRVGKAVLNGSETWGLNNSNKYRYQYVGSDIVSAKKVSRQKVVSDKILSDDSEDLNNVVWIYDGITVVIHTGLTTVDELRAWLSQNPVMVYYELETPVITEVDLEGFPYIYKDGHIFLNGEIAPVTEIKYSINQQHQIEANNQDIMRHQKEIDYLYKLIGEYVRVDYKNTLLSLNLELK